MTNILTLLIVMMTIGANAQFGSTVQLCLTEAAHQHMLSVDFESDGDYDIITIEGGSIGMDNPSNMPIYAQSFALCENLGGGVFSIHPLFTLSEPSLYAFGDLNGDGLLDFMHTKYYDHFLYVFGMETLSLSGSNSIYLKENLGGFVYAPDVTITTIQNYYPYQLDANSLPMTTGNIISRLAFGDLNNDGMNEVLFATTRPYHLYDEVLSDTYGQMNYPGYSIEYISGVFGVPIFLAYLAWGPHPEYQLSSLEIKDFNQDGLNDIGSYVDDYLSEHYDYMWSSYQVAYATGNIASPFESPYFFSAQPLLPQPHVNSPLSASRLIDADDAIDWVSVFTNYQQSESIVYMENSMTTSASSQGSIDFAGVYFYTDLAIANGIAAIDLGNDGVFEVIVPTTNGSLYIFNNPDEWASYSSFGGVEISGLLYDTGITEEIDKMMSMDYDNDGDEDLIFLASGQVYALINDTAIDVFAQLHVNQFIDNNGNGIQNIGELPYNNSILQLGLQGQVPETFYGINGDGQLSWLLETGTYELSINDNDPVFDPAFAIEQVLDLNSSADELTLNLPFVVVNELDLVNAYIGASSGICGSPSVNHYLVLSNDGSSVASGSVTYYLDDLHTYLGADIAPNNISGNTITWTYSNLAPTDLVVIQLTVSSASLSDLGEFVTNAITVTIEDAFNNVIFTESLNESYEVTCSYDPNDITEHNGHTDAGYILTGDELEYTIQFQNTGNAPAQDVRIENQLSEKLDWSSMQPVAWSHDFQLIVDETGRAIFTFDEINLPDSVNNEAESHGFVRFRIMSDTDLSFGETIESTAEIFFDFNPAVVTNTEMNTIYECSDLEQGMASETEVCAGESIELGNNAIWIEELTWTFEGVEVGSGDYTHVVNESGTMVMHASNALCSYDQSIEITALVATASFTQNGNTLSASNATTYQWYLNGNEIANATAQTFEITQTGNYSVMITDDNGCSAMSDAMMVTYIGVNEKTKNSISVYPNPIAEISTVRVPENLLGKYFHVYTTSGELVLSGKLNGRSHPINCEDLAPGVYILRIENERVMLVKS